MKNQNKFWLIAIAVAFITWIAHYQFSEWKSRKQYPVLHELLNCLEEKKVGVSRQQVLGTFILNDKDNFFELDSLCESHSCLSHLTAEKRMDTFLYEYNIMHGNQLNNWDEIKEEITNERNKRFLLRKWSGNQLENGDNPYSYHWGNPIIANTENQLVIRNTGIYDVVIVLVKDDDRTVGDYYVRFGSNYTITGIPNGKYYIKRLSGKNWCPETEFVGGLLKGGFLSNVHFSSSKDESVMDFQQTGETYTTYELTLETTEIEGDEFLDASTNELDFFR